MAGIDFRRLRAEISMAEVLALLDFHRDKWLSGPALRAVPDQPNELKETRPPFFCEFANRPVLLSRVRPIWRSN
jgi:hypothetical protein